MISFTKKLIFTDGSPFTVSLFAYPAVGIDDDPATHKNDNNYLVKKDITGVTAEANKTTIVTGQLFKNYNNGGGFHISINPDWNPTPVTVPF